MRLIVDIPDGESPIVTVQKVREQFHPFSPTLILDGPEIRCLPSTTFLDAMGEILVAETQQREQRRRKRDAKP